MNLKLLKAPKATLSTCPNFLASPRLPGDCIQTASPGKEPKETQNVADPGYVKLNFLENHAKAESHRARPIALLRCPGRMPARKISGAKRL